MIATLATVAARAAALADVDPDEISFTAELGLVRAHLQVGTRCPHCGRCPDGPLARLLADVIAHPRNRANRKQTSGRTQPNGARGTSKKPRIPSRSRRQISRNGTNLSEVKGSATSSLHRTLC